MVVVELCDAMQCNECRTLIPVLTSIKETVSIPRQCFNRADDMGHGATMEQLIIGRERKRENKKNIYIYVFVCVCVCVCVCLYVRMCHACQW